MDKGTGIATTINSNVVSLVFNEDVLLGDANTSLIIAFPKTENNGWIFKFVFTDEIPIGQRAFSSKTTFEEGNKIVFTYYSWYGTGIETSKPHYIESADHKLKLYIIVRTTALKSVPSRKVQVCMWKIANP